MRIAGDYLEKVQAMIGAPNVTVNAFIIYIVRFSCNARV